MLRSFVRWTSEAALPSGCPFASGAFEFEDEPRAVREQLAGFSKRWYSLFEKFVEEAKHAAPAPAPDQVTWEAFGIYTMHHVSVRLLGDASADHRAMQAFDRLVSCYQNNDY